MKIAYIFMNFPAPSEVFGRVEIDSLRRRGVEVTCYSLFSKFLTPSECHYVSFLDRMNTILRLIFSPFLVFSYLYLCFNVSKTKVELFKNIFLIVRAEATACEISKENPDIVHFFWGHYPSTVMFFLKRKGDFKYSVFTGAYDLESKLGIMEWGVNNSDIAFTHAEYNLALINEFYSKKVNVIYRGVKTNGVEPINKTISDEVKFVSVGRLDHSKRPDIVLSVFKFIKENIEMKTSLQIFGDGVLKEHLIQQTNYYGIHDCVEFCGHVSQVEMFKVIEESHFILFPSEQASERLPNSVKESMNLGCIPLVSKTSGIEELVENKVSGYVVDFSDTDNILNIVKVCVEDMTKYTSLSMNAQKRIRNKFCVDKLAELKVKRYEGVLYL